jgi:hypothetical protein
MTMCVLFGVQSTWMREVSTERVVVVVLGEFFGFVGGGWCVGGTGAGGTDVSGSIRRRLGAGVDDAGWWSVVGMNASRGKGDVLVPSC